MHFIIDPFMFGDSNYPPGETFFGTAVPGSQTTFVFTSELGMRFQSDVDGTVTKLRFYAPANFNGSTTNTSGSLWNAAGTRLVEEFYPTITPDAWNELTLASPVHINAATVYTVSRNVTDNAFFAPPNLTPPLNNGSHLSIPAAGFNGVFGTQDTFPSSNGLGQNYYNDIEFVPD